MAMSKSDRARQKRIKTLESIANSSDATVSEQMRAIDMLEQMAAPEEVDIKSLGVMDRAEIRAELRRCQALINAM